MDSTRQMAFDSDLEDIVVYADEDPRKDRVVQDQQGGQTMLRHLGRSYAHLQQQLLSTQSNTQGWLARGRRNDLLGDSAKMNLQQQFEQSVAAEGGGPSLQRLLARDCTHLDEASGRDLLLAQKQDSTAAPLTHRNKGHRFGVSLTQHSSPLKQRSLAGEHGRQKPSARKGAVKATFAIRKPQPAGIGLKASLQQLRGGTNSSQANQGREEPAEDVIANNAEDEQEPQSNPQPDLSQAALQTPGEAREPFKAAGGMSAQRDFLASVLKPGKRQNQGIPQQVLKRTGRAASMKGPLTGRLHTILQEEKLLSARGSGKEYLQVQVTEREQQGSTVTCRCNVVSGSIATQSVIALFKSSMGVETHVGSRLNICSPWRECTVSGQSWHDSRELKLPAWPFVRGRWKSAVI